MGKVIDILFEGIYFTKLLLIISDKNEAIAKEIGEKIKLRDLLYGLMLRSGNDAAIVIAKEISGSMENFVYFVHLSLYFLANILILFSS